MYLLTNEEEMLCLQIKECALVVHKELGQGLLEQI